MPTLNAEQNFSHLSLKDLVEARDMFHVHLMNKKNVVATAIGRYLVRVNEIDENGKYVSAQGQKPARTLNNSVVIDISWPCILVFVSQWLNDIELVKAGASNIVPKTIYMPDGRMVPVCIVEAPKNQITDTSVDVESLRFPTNFIGGGFPVIVDKQKERHYATLGCLVSDGHTYYALTNKHVAGGKGEVIQSKIKGSVQRIGVSAGKELGKIPFKSLYPEWQSANIMISCDAALVEIDDIRDWTTLLIGTQQMDELYDLNTYNLSLNLISEHEVKKVIKDGKDDFEIKDAKNGKVNGYAAVSGKLMGEIKALFYRYNSTGGVEYASDFLIGGRCLHDLQVHYGDSGTLWLLEVTGDDEKVYIQPIALHWGQHQLINGADQTHFTYSLSTSLSNICRELKVELVRGWNIDIEFSWGKVGHYTVGNKAISSIADTDFKQFMAANLDNISLPEDQINDGLDQKGGSSLLPTDPTQGFCPLADVPDIIWKQYKVSKDGTTGHPWGRKGDENPNHFADADAPSIGGKNLFKICDEVSKMTVDIWTDYYENIDLKSIGMDPAEKVTQGLICFRVWQIFDYMKKSLEAKEISGFIFAAGVLAHYVGDGCQPLHSSYMADGDPIDGVSTMYTPPRGGSKHPKGVPYAKVINPGSGVHVAYEDKMIDAYIGEIMPLLNAAVTTEGIIPGVDIKITNGQEAAFAVLKLMEFTQNTIPPKNIVETFKKVKKDGGDMSQELYDAFGEKTVTILAAGSRCLAAIWEAAWVAGNGKSIDASELVKVDTKELIKLYENPDELKSYHLDTIGSILKS